MIEANAREIRALLELAELDRIAQQLGEERGPRDRQKVADGLPIRILDRYERLLDLGRSPAVVATSGGACSGCHIRLPTMVESKTRRTVGLHTCPHCQRMLYAPELVPEEKHAGHATSRHSGTETPAAVR